MTSLAQGTLAALRATSTATLTSRLYRRGLHNVYMQGVKPINVPARKLVGMAFTLRFIPAREDLDGANGSADPNDLMRAAVEATPEGHVLVLDCRQETRASVGGELLFARLRTLGAAGVVSDGCVRTSQALGQASFPVFCAGASTPVSRSLHHPLEFGRPVACGGVAVYPGDVVVGDADGVIVIPSAIATEIAGTAWEQERMERYLLQKIRDGAPLEATYPPDEQTKLDYRAWAAANGRDA